MIVAGLALAFHQPILSTFSGADLEVKIEHPPVIMPAVYKVYENEDALDGKYSLFKMMVTNSGENTARNVEVSFEVPGFLEWETIQKFPVILPGQSVVVNCYPSFDQKVVEKTTASKEKVNIRISGSNIEEVEESFGIEMKGRNEFMYTFIPSEEIRTPGEYFDNALLMACLVTPEDPIIKYFTQQIQEKILKGETAAVTNKDEEGVRFMAGIYNATFLSHMVYSGTSGVPSDVNGVSSITQSIRLPREVVTGKTGLCIELSLLYASIMMNAGMDPVIFLIPGHAYPGFRMNGKYYAIEATGIGGEGMKGGRASAQQAFQTGMKEIQQFIKGMQSGDDRYQLLDVRDAIKKGAVAIELKDDPYLRKRIDEIAQSFDGSQYSTNTRQLTPNNANYVNSGGNSRGNSGGNSGGGNSGNSGTPSGYRNYSGAVSFAYPGSWKALPRNEYSMPQMVKLIANSNNSAYIEVYRFNGINSGEQALQYIQGFVGNMGGQIQYSASGQSGGFSVYNGQTSFQGNGIQWVAAFKRTGSGMAGIVTGSNTSVGGKYKGVIKNILNSLK